MALIGQLLEELMGDKFNSQYKADEYKGRKIPVGIGDDQVRGKEEQPDLGFIKGLRFETCSRLDSNLTKG